MSENRNTTKRATPRKTYEELLAETLDKLKAKAALATGYVATLDAEDACESELEWIRPEIKKSHDEIRGLRKIIARHERHAKRWGLDGVDQYWIGAFERAETRLRVEKAFRDEIKEGVRMSRKVRREEAVALSKLLREIEAERAKGLKV